MKRLLMAIASLLLLIVAGTASTLWLAFGGGKPYPDLSGTPQLGPDDLQVAVRSERPIGNAAVAQDGRIYFTIHPESMPEYPKLYVALEGELQPFPSVEKQKSVLETPLGVAIDQQNRLWVIDPGNHGTGRPALIAFDLDTAEVVHHHLFDSSIAPLGSFLQDLQISSDGRWIYIADVGFWAKRPAIVVYDTQTQNARRVLNRHPSVMPENYLIRTQIRDMSYLGGLLEMKTGIDGVALSRDDHWLYYAAMNHTSLYRIATTDLQNSELNDATLAQRIEEAGNKPLNDGLSIDNQDNVFITDVEHQAVVKMLPSGELQTVVKDDRIRWADGLSFGPDGWLYLADSAIPHLVLQSQKHISKQAPYFIWRFKPGSTATAGR